MASTKIQTYLSAAVATDATVTVTYPSGFSTSDPVDLLAAQVSINNMLSALPSAAYTIAWGTSTAVITNKQIDTWKAGSSLFLYIPDQVGSVGGTAANFSVDAANNPILTVPAGFDGGKSFPPTIAVRTLSADLTLVATDATYQLLDPNGADRVVTLPASGVFSIRNTGSANTITAKNAGGTTIGAAIAVSTTQAQGYASSAWRVL